tara:strand:- start:3073 stop:3216 length:144 start_codon:yes stop_codon:yes gene_type:complete
MIASSVVEVDRIPVHLDNGRHAEVIYHLLTIRDRFTSSLWLLCKSAD